MYNSRRWVCSRCAACCRIAGKFSLAFFNGKDSACKYLDGNKCTIYEKRPRICRVQDYSKVEELTEACGKIRRYLHEQS